MMTKTELNENTNELHDAAAALGYARAWEEHRHAYGRGRGFSTSTLEVLLAASREALQHVPARHARAIFDAAYAAGARGAINDLVAHKGPALGVVTRARGIKS